MAGKTTKKTTSNKTAPIKASTTRSQTKTTRVVKTSPVKKAAPRRTPAKVERVEKNTRVESRPTAAHQSRSLNFSQMKVRKSTVFIGLGVVVLLVLLYLLRGWFVVATVNGQPITRLSVIHELEQAYGKQQLNTDISKTLILQEASRRHINVTQSDIDADVKNVEKQLSAQGQKLDDVLTQQGMTRPQWLEGERIRVILQKMFAGDIKVSDKDIDTYITQNKTSLPEDAATNKTTRTNISQQLQQQKLSAKIQSFLTAQQKSAKIHYIVNY